MKFSMARLSLTPARLSFVAVALLGCLAPAAVAQSEPPMGMPVTTFREQFNASDFFFDFEAALEASDALPGGKVVVNSLGTAPALLGTRTAGALVEVNPCGMLLPHTHPRATEQLYTLEGELLVGFVDENTPPREITVSAGQAFVFPQGTLHFQLNRSCRPAKFLAILSHEDPGAQFQPLALNSINAQALATAYGLEGGDLKDVLAAGPMVPLVEGVASCLARCGNY